MKLFRVVKSRVHPGLSWESYEPRCLNGFICPERVKKELVNPALFFCNYDSLVLEHLFHLVLL